MPTDYPLRASSGDASHFTSLPWCARLIQDPNFKPIVTTSRQPKASTEDSFFAGTLQTSDTIRACLSLAAVPDPNANPPIREVRTLLALGDGVNGYPHVCHGGLVATILDEAIGILLIANLDYVYGKGGEGLADMTVELKVRYKGPVTTPGVVVVKAVMVKAEGRKKFCRATIEAEEGNVLAEGEAVFVQVKAKM